MAPSLVARAQLLVRSLALDAPVASAMDGHAALAVAVHVHLQDAGFLVVAGEGAALVRGGKLAVDATMWRGERRHEARYRYKDAEDVEVCACMTPMGRGALAVDVSVNGTTACSDILTFGQGDGTLLEGAASRALLNSVADTVVAPTLRVVRDAAGLPPLPSLLTLPEEVKEHVVCCVAAACVADAQRNPPPARPSEEQAPPPRASVAARTLVSLAQTSRHLAAAADTEAAWRTVLDADFRDWRLREEARQGDGATLRVVYRALLAAEKRSHRERGNFLRMLQTQRAPPPRAPFPPPRGGVPGGFPGMIGGDYDRFPGGGGGGFGGGFGGGGFGGMPRGGGFGGGGFF